MFRLHDRTRRRLALGLFGLLVVLPTTLAVVWAVWLHVPGYVQTEADRLSQQLGVRVSLLKVRPLTPATTVYDGVELFDPETGAPLLFCGRLEVHERWFSSAASGSPQASLVLTGSEVAIDLTQADSLGQVLERLLSRRTGWGDVDVQFEASQLGLRKADRSIEPLYGVQLRLQGAPQESRAEATFRLTASERDDAIRVVFGRSREHESPSRHFAFATGRSAVPCRLLPAWLGLSELLGPQSSVQGSLKSRRTERGWSAELADPRAPLVFQNVDLDRLVSQRFPPHTLRGTGRITLQPLRQTDGRLQELQGWIECFEGGEVSPSLLEAATQRLALPDHPLPSQALLPYRRLALGFSIDKQGLRVWCGDPQSKTIVQGANGPLLLSGDMQPQPVTALVQLLVPEGHVALPTSASATWLLERLPLPPNPPQTPERWAHRPQ